MVDFLIILVTRIKKIHNKTVVIRTEVKVQLSREDLNCQKNLIMELPLKVSSINHFKDYETNGF